MERPNRTSTVPRFCLGKTRFFLCLSIMGTWKALCKAFEHIATAFWPLCGWNATFCYTILSERGGTKGGFGSHVSMEPHNRTSTVPRFCLGKTEVFCVSGRIDHHWCMEVVMQGLRAHSDSFLAAMWLECYVLLHYFERARATKG